MILRRHTKLLWRHHSSAAYWTISVGIYATLIYATALHFAYGPEHTITMDWHFAPAGAQRSQFQVQYPDLGALRDHDVNREPEHFWKMSSYYGDAGYYLLQVRSFDLSIAPFKYRVLPTLLVRLITSTTGFGAAKSFVVLNVILTLCTAVIFACYLMSHFKFTRELALLGGCLFVTMVANTDTIGFPMMESASLFFSMLIFLALIRRDAVLFVLSSVLGV